VTLDIGFNDLETHSLEALPVAMASIGRNLPGILAELRAAAGPGTPIRGHDDLRRLSADMAPGTAGPRDGKGSVLGSRRAAHAHFREIYRAAGIAVADVEGLSPTTDFDTEREIEGRGDRADQRRQGVRVDLGRGAAAPGPDLHANAGGYRTIAEAFARVIFD